MWPSPKILRHSRVDEDVTVGNCRNYPLLVANDLMLLATSQQGRQNALDWSSAACIQVGTKINPKQTDVLCISRRPKQCILQVSDNIVFCSRWSLSTLILYGGIHELQRSEQRDWNPNSEPNAVPRELCCSVVKTGAFKVWKAFSF